uniref:AlNc14C391G11286 protein n=1 Tax=Albugo laibachii Nc14 TaxID=890382 RepID=F0WYM2_9STRA|nr:AlNc14C391G11286 [Albugo laibachii Nc14]CCA27305.1 AlNc14C502G11958 [Albugo laibachii Nc14]|eukprot:CCA27305.1 AlNc14C502G11958 [Albugo laibachii Nc14]
MASGTQRRTSLCCRLRLRFLGCDDDDLRHGNTCSVKDLRITCVTRRCAERIGQSRQRRRLGNTTSYPVGNGIEANLLPNLGVRDQRQLALRLKKGLYGLKQSGRLWNLMLHDILNRWVSFNALPTAASTLRLRPTVRILVGIYVDDLLVTGTSVKKVNDFFNDMQVVELKGLGVVVRFLGIIFKYTAESSGLSTKKITSKGCSTSSG